jgi:transposase
MTETNPCGIRVGIDLAKNIFAVHGVDQNGKAVLIKPKVSRDQLLALIAQLSPCLIGLEACSGAHHWARLFRTYGHTVKLIAPKFVTPYGEAMADQTARQGQEGLPV